MYQPSKVESDMLLFWDVNNIYGLAKKKNAKGKKFYFLQGPPYTSGRIHLGHAWNNSLKDLAMRYKRMQGYNVWDRAGYDMHGLPTESKVQKQFQLETKEDIIKFGVEKFIQECMKFADEKAGLMNNDLKRLGIWMDFENAYKPIANDYISGEWWLIKKAYEKNRLYEGLRTIGWCAYDQTALAKHEQEYREIEDNSVFAKFKLKSKNDEYLIIWTTTPWTLAFNLAVMVNPKIDYVKARVGNETWIIASDLAGSLITGLLNKKYKVISEFKGKKLAGLEYIHPWHDEIKAFSELKKQHPKVHTIVLSEEYVSLSAGSGLVHCAPGCGPEDYEIGYRNNLPAFNNTSESGVFPNDMGKFSGLTAKKDDRKFIEALEEANSLVNIQKIKHEYAHCERCKNPIIFRTTKQWFFKVEDLKKKMLAANKKIHWIPESGQNAFDAWLGNLRDNSITKQRFWGTPLPIWRCEKCHKITVIGSEKELRYKAENAPESLHIPWIDKTRIKCSCNNYQYRLPDVLDVWIDAGTASWNCLYYPERLDYFKKFFPADFILEAREQVRGWFNLLMIASILALDKPSFKNVYMHGMLTDVSGIKMSKSIGNVISPYEIVDKYGADTLRYYTSTVAAGEDMNFSWPEISLKSKNLLVLWNIHNYLLDLCRTNNKKPGTLASLDIEEKYIISKLNSSIKHITEYLDHYQLDKIANIIEELYLELSRTYIQLVREKASIGTEKEKQLVITTIYEVLINTLKLFAPIVPFITEAIYQNLRKELGLKNVSIHLEKWPNYNKKLINTNIEEKFNVAKKIIQDILAEREKAKIGVRWPLQKAIVHIPDYDKFKELRTVIKKGESLDKIAIKSASKFKTLEHIKEIMPLIRKQTNLKELDIKLGEFKVELDTKLTPELEQEGFARELTRRIQALRKKAGLTKIDKVNMAIISSLDLGRWLDDIKNKVGAKTIITSLPKDKYNIYSKEEIRDVSFEIYIDR